jgi:IS4 transposase
MRHQAEHTIGFPEEENKPSIGIPTAEGLVGRTIYRGVRRIAKQQSGTKIAVVPRVKGGSEHQLYKGRNFGSPANFQRFGRVVGRGKIGQQEHVPVVRLDKRSRGVSSCDSTWRNKEVSA